MRLWQKDYFRISNNKKEIQFLYLQNKNCFLGKRKGEQFLHYWITKGWVVNNGTDKKADYAVKKYPVD